MTTLLLIVLVSLGALFLWGFLAPRSQWRILASWSYRDPYRNEPTGGVYGLYRVVSLIGIASLVVSGLFVYRMQLESTPPPPVPPTQAEIIWGIPEPVVVNRVVKPLSIAPAGLVDQPILGYQDMTGKTRQPPYLFSLANFNNPEATDANGFIGVDASPGLVALDTAKMVVRVSGDPQCFPRAAVVKETSETVSIAIYYGRAMPDPAAPPENLNACGVLNKRDHISTLIPIPLIEPLGNREVVALDGTPIPRVESGN